MQKKYRIGLGFDIHRTKKGIPLILGGCKIPSDFGLVSHTDGDVVIHALVDAILSAVGAPDIGLLFPPDAPELAKVSSTELLKAVLASDFQKKFSIEQVDVTILAESPKLSPSYGLIRTEISTLLGLREEDVGVKARSFEGLGEIGRGEAIAAYALVLVSHLPRKKLPLVGKPSLKVAAIKPVDKTGAQGSIEVYADGASRGNPGPSSCSCVIVDVSGRVLHSEAKKLGFRTNNEAEYEAVIFALEVIRNKLGKSRPVVINIDSELIFGQITGRFQVRSEQLKSLYQEVAARASALPNVQLRLVPREKNEMADKLARNELKEI